MSETSIPIDLPLDADSFLRRECPTCERQFKWWPTPPPEEFSEETQEAPEAYYCPYCHEPADPETWWTKEQLEYVQRLGGGGGTGARNAPVQERHGANQP